MAATSMRIKKGDLVQILSGKDRGKQGKVLEARPKDRRVIVESLNIVKRHTKPRPMKDSSRLGGPALQARRGIQKPAPLDVSDVTVRCPGRHRPTRLRRP